VGVAHTNSKALSSRVEPVLDWVRTCVSFFGFHAATSAILLLVVAALVGSCEYWGASYLWHRYEQPFFAFEPWIGILFMAFVFLAGFLVLDYCRYSIRSYWAPLMLLIVLWLVLVLLLYYEDGNELQNWHRDALQVLREHPWPPVIILLAFLFQNQFAAFLSRVRTAEAGPVKLEADRIDEAQKSLNTWKRTVTTFGEMMGWVCDLLEQTPPDDVVRFLAYTPALGFLTRPEREWRRLYQLLIRRPNIQFICLEEKELAEWHARFKDKRTARPEGLISEEMTKRSTQLAKFILAGQRRSSDPCNWPVELKWPQMPGYYLFANRERALIATPLFFPMNPLGYVPRDNAASATFDSSKVDNSDQDVPVQMVGFESSDNWTVWLANDVCRRLSDAQPKKQTDEASKVADAAKTRAASSGERN